MKKFFFSLIIALFFFVSSYAQVEDRFGYLDDTQISDYVKPLVTTLGTAFNSASYHSASIPKLWGFGISFNAMIILVPDDQLTYTPKLPDNYIGGGETATIWGNKGGAFAGPEGFVVFPAGINKSSIPIGYPQISFSTMGTELLVRYLPKIDLGETDIGFWGAGISHSISQYIPLVPVDFAVQILYNSFSMKDLVDASNIAFNVHASKSFGLFTGYAGLQYESSSMDLSYTYNDPNGTGPDQDFTVSIDGDNSFRFTLGGTLKLAVVSLNIDYSLGSQSVATGGLSFEF